MGGWRQQPTKPYRVRRVYRVKLWRHAVCPDRVGTLLDSASQLTRGTSLTFRSRPASLKRCSYTAEALRPGSSDRYWPVWSACLHWRRLRLSSRRKPGSSTGQLCTNTAPLQLWTLACTSAKLPKFPSPTPGHKARPHRQPQRNFWPMVEVIKRPRHPSCDHRVARCETSGCLPRPTQGWRSFAASMLHHAIRSSP